MSIEEVPKHGEDSRYPHEVGPHQESAALDEKYYNERYGVPPEGSVDTDDIGEWLESAENDPEFVSKILASKDLKELQDTASLFAKTLAKLGIISDEQCADKLRMIGIEK